jgi:hypothetical protein
MVLALSLAAAGSPLSAQDASLKRGDTVRVSAIAPPLRGAMGALVSRSRDSIQVRLFAAPGAKRTTITIPLAAVEELEVQRRRGPRIVTGLNVLLGAAMGALVGGPVGAALRCGSCSQAGGADLESGFYGAVAGIVVGGIVGANAFGERRASWERIRP